MRSLRWWIRTLCPERKRPPRRRKRAREHPEETGSSRRSGTNAGQIERTGQRSRAEGLLLRTRATHIRRIGNETSVPKQGINPCASRRFYTAPMPDITLWPTGRLLSTAARLVEHAWNEKLDGLSLTHAGVIALEVLVATGPMTQSALAQIVRVQAQTIGQTLTRLESGGYVHRQRSQSDRRSQMVSITDAGNAAVKEARGLERSVLESAAVDTDKLRKELQTIVLVLAARDEQARRVIPD
jgi:MarR family transcriptional regulator, organic hydroperoxide resistance regulator